jgi:hypothetical protein
LPEHGQGFLSRLDSGGRTVETRWVTGLNQVKNIAVHGDHLYAADSHALVVVDIDAAAIVVRYHAPDSTYIDGCDRASQR